MPMRNLENCLIAFEFGTVEVGFWKGGRVRALKSAFVAWEMRKTEIPEVPISPALGGKGYYTPIENVLWDNHDVLNGQFGYPKGFVAIQAFQQEGGCSCGFPGAGCGGGGCDDCNCDPSVEFVSTESSHRDDGPCDGCVACHGGDDCPCDGCVDDFCSECAHNVPQQSATT